jgi:hypothetical protein
VPSYVQSIGKFNLVLGSILAFFVVSLPITAMKFMDHIEERNFKSRQAWQEFMAKERAAHPELYVTSSAVTRKLTVDDMSAVRPAYTVERCQPIPQLGGRVYQVLIADQGGASWALVQSTELLTKGDRVGIVNLGDLALPMSLENRSDPNAMFVVKKE